MRLLWLKRRFLFFFPVFCCRIIYYYRSCIVYIFILLILFSRASFFPRRNSTEEEREKWEKNFSSFPALLTSTFCLFLACHEYFKTTYETGENGKKIYFDLRYIVFWLGELRGRGKKTINMYIERIYNT